MAEAAKEGTQQDLQSTETGPSMSIIELRALVNLLMVSDPWPLSAAERKVMVTLADRESRHWGFTDWIDA